ncbi:unnamed protein product [Effrenium voratum]|nr:unnamed protein product [Effrenium voratum]
MLLCSADLPALTPMDRLALWDWRAGHWAALGSAGLLSVWAWKAAAASAPLSAEWRIFATLWREGFLRVFFPRDEDGTRYMGVLERLKRVSELRAVLGLERFHQIDLAKQRKRNTVGWGKTAGTHHMQHLPDLVFRGRDRRIARAALQRAAQLFAEPQRCLQLHQEWDRTPIFQDLVLVGGGHSHVHVLRMLGMEPVPGVRVTLVTRDVETPYSGMLPGHIAGLYTREECHLDLNILARFARVRLVHASVEGIDLQKKRVILAGDRPPLSYDVLSINIGSAPKVQEDAGEAGVTPVKPIDGFGARWDALLRTVPSWQGERRLLVVGGGAGGFELAMSIKARLTKELAALESSAVVHVALVSRATLLPQHTSGARALARQALKQKGIELISGCDVSHAENGRLYCHDGRSLHYDDCIWCTQGSPQQWVGTCGLRVDREGFLLVDQQLRCSGNGQDVGPVFAGGDIATVLDHPRPKAGVFAVMAGMVLWINLRATLRSEKLVTYWPQQSFLGLLNLGDGSCIASRGSLGAQGEWLWGLKDWIDRRWMWNYCQGLPEMPTAEPPASAALGSGRRSGELLSLLRKSAMRCGGCGAKVGATTLAQAMARCSSYIPRQPERGEKAQVVVGAGDDAAVVDFFHANGKISTVQSIDFFRSFVEDPFATRQRFVRSFLRGLVFAFLVHIGRQSFEPIESASGQVGDALQGYGV